MNEYIVEYDTIDDGWFERSYSVHNYGPFILWIKGVLSAYGGGHADIYNKNGDFVEDVEV